MIGNRLVNTSVRHVVGIEPLEPRRLFAATAIGMNLEKVVDYNSGYMFTDAFLASRSWFSHAYNTATGQMSWDGGGAVNVDAKGWPTALNTFTNASGQLVQQRLGTQMFNDIDGRYPSGQYTAHWRGTATITWGRDVRSVTPLPDLPDGTHRATLNVVASPQGMYMRVDALNAADPLRDVHVWMPDYNGQSFVGQVWRPGATFSPFHPQFKERLDPFQVVRPLQTTHGISSDEVRWSDRKPVDAARQSTFAGEFENGMSWEYVVQMANELGHQPWLNMPYLADDDYIENLARLVKSSLDPSLKVYVEWSNELWNYQPGFEGHQWLNQQLALPENAGLNIYDLWAREAKRDFDIWSQVFADSPQRLVRVVAGQAANSYVAQQVLQRMDGKFDAVSCDGYVTFAQPELAQFDSTTTADQVVDALLNSSLGHTLGFLRNHEALAQQYSQSLGRPIELVVYEGGPLLQGSGRPYEQAFLDAGRDPRMYTLYERLLRGANEIGVDLFTAFVFTDCSPFGDASHLRWLDQPTAEAHKYRAVVDAASGALFIPEVGIAMEGGPADEAGPRGVSVVLTRSGDADVPLVVGLSAGGSADTADYTGLPASVAFAAGERVRSFTIVPVDDTLIEGDETLTITLLGGGNYRLNAAARAATTTLRDNDTRVIMPLAIANPSFENGGLAGWTLVPATGNFTTVASAFTDPNAPATARQGTAYAWGAGLTGQSGNGALTAGVAQRVDVSTMQAGIDSGLATLQLRGWGAGGGTGAQYAQIEVAFYDAAAGGNALGVTHVSAPARDLRTWSQMTISAAVPAGTRSVEVRAMTVRPQTFFSNRAGFDDLSGEIEYPLAPAVATTGVNAGEAQRSMVNSLSVRFTVPVTPSAGAFELRRRGTGELVQTSAANPSGDSRTWVLTFSGASVVAGSLADGVYDLTLRAAALRDSANQFFNGGTDAVAVTVRRLFGDADGDGDVDAVDALRFRQAQGTLSTSSAYRAWFDADGDGDVDAVDSLRFRQRLGSVLPL